MFLVVTPLYLALAALMLVVLSVRIILLRKKFQAGLGDKNEPSLKKAIRVHGNFTEYVPLALLMLAALEMSGYPAFYLHALGCCLLLGRLLHAFGVSQLRENLLWRVSGMALTFLTLVSAAVLLFLQFVFS